MRLDNLNTNATVNVPVEANVILKAQHMEETTSGNRGGDYPRHNDSKTVIDGLELAVKVTASVSVDVSMSVAHADVDLRDVGKMVDRVCDSVDRAIFSERRCERDCKTSKDSTNSLEKMITDKVKTELRNQMKDQLKKAK